MRSVGGGSKDSDAAGTAASSKRAPCSLTHEKATLAPARSCAAWDAQPYDDRLVCLFPAARHEVWNGTHGRDPALADRAQHYVGEALPVAELADAV
eukprot:3890458-Pleurochrysis_carterae.AAC.2